MDGSFGSIVPRSIWQQNSNWFFAEINDKQLGEFTLILPTEAALPSFSVRHSEVPQERTAAQPFSICIRSPTPPLLLTSQQYLVLHLKPMLSLYLNPIPSFLRLLLLAGFYPLAQSGLEFVPCFRFPSVKITGLRFPSLPSRVFLASYRTRTLPFDIHSFSNCKFFFGSLLPTILNLSRSSIFPTKYFSC